MARATETMKQNLADLYYKKEIVDDFWADVTRQLMGGKITVDEAYDMAMEEPLIDFGDFTKEVTERGYDVSHIEWL